MWCNLLLLPFYFLYICFSYESFYPFLPAYLSMPGFLRVLLGFLILSLPLRNVKMRTMFKSNRSSQGRRRSTKHKKTSPLAGSILVDTLLHTLNRDARMKTRGQLRDIGRTMVRLLCKALRRAAILPNSSGRRLDSPQQKSG